MRNDFRKPGRDSGSRDFKRGGFGHGRNRNENREMHKAKCADCGSDCEVPFKPREDRPVYCKECYSKHKPQRF